MLRAAAGRGAGAAAAAAGGLREGHAAAPLSEIIPGDPDPAEPCGDVAPFTFVLGWGLVGVVLLLGVAQWVKIVQRQTHRGLSLPDYCCLSLAAWLQMGNYVCREYSGSAACCAPGHPLYACVGNVAALAGAVCVWIAAAAAAALRLALSGGAAGRPAGAEAEQQGWWRARVAAAAAAVAHAVAAAIPTTLSLLDADGLRSDAVRAYGAGAGAVAGALVVALGAVRARAAWRGRGAAAAPGAPPLLLSAVGSALLWYNAALHTGDTAVQAPYAVCTATAGLLTAGAVYLTCLERCTCDAALATSASGEQKEGSSRASPVVDIGKWAAAVSAPSPSASWHSVASYVTLWRASPRASLAVRSVGASLIPPPLPDADPPPPCHRCRGCCRCRCAGGAEPQTPPQPRRPAASLPSPPPAPRRLVWPSPPPPPPADEPREPRTPPPPAPRGTESLSPPPAPRPLAWPAPAPPALPPPARCDEAASMSRPRAVLPRPPLSVSV